MKYFYTLLLLIFPVISFASDKVTVSPVPEWVHSLNYNDEKSDPGSGGYQYLLINYQHNLIEKSNYRHFVIKINNSEGVQSVSDIDISFDPSYQKLLMHKVTIKRNGEEINKLNKSDIKVIQQEKSKERYLYDGSLSAIMNLSDVRAGDILEYSYSVTGYNPINKDNYSSVFYLQYTIPVNRIYVRTIFSPAKKLNYKLFEGAAEPKIIIDNNRSEYIWDVEAHDKIMYDSNVPAWVDYQRRVAVSTFNSWQEVVDWALPFYKQHPETAESIKNEIELPVDKEERIIQLIRFVQDEIRYLGFESGISAYKPNEPKKVFSQRYGDCKDKSLLLVSLLQSEGVAAYPVLVNTEYKQEIQNFLPSHIAFDHCIVYLKFNDAEYFVDPTISGQGGNLKNMVSPPYKLGLVLRENQSRLKVIPEPSPSAMNILETIRLDSIGGGATMKVRTEYTGSQADYNRSYFQNNSHIDIQKDYLNFYVSLYHGIESDGDVKIYDDYRGTTNKVIVEEFYKIDNFWNDTTGEIYCEFYPLVLESKVNYSKSPSRKMPYYLGTPNQFAQVTQIHLPEEWNLNNTEYAVEGDAFSYSNKINKKGNNVTIKHEYELKRSFIEPEALNAFITKHKEIQGQLSYYLTYNRNFDGFKLSWISLFLVFFTLGGGIVGALRLHREYNPKPYSGTTNLPIGGWLILPAIGVILSPFILFKDLAVSTDYFNHNFWTGYMSGSYDNAYYIVMLFGAEIIYNVLFLIFSVLILILFFQKRSSLPRLISVYYALAVIVPVIDLYLVDLFVGGVETEESTYSDIGRRFVAALIWIPYFTFSDRVKNTFSNTVGRKKQIDEFTEEEDILVDESGEGKSEQLPQS